MTSIRFTLGVLLISTCSVAALTVAQRPGGGVPRSPWLIAHRGASAYAPENTIPALQAAAEQGATFVEFDVQMTKDRHIVCLHDNSLERTTDVEAIFPDRFRAEGRNGKPARRWMIEDFTLAEIKRLDAGAWFDATFRGTRIPTFTEAVTALRGRSGLFIELKTPDRYDGIERLVLAELKALGLDRPGADPNTPVLLQSFSAASLQRLAALRTALPVHFLISAGDAERWMTSEGLERVKAFSTGISPEKTIVTKYPEAMERARAMGLRITPYTFRAGAVHGFPDVRAEMRHYLETLGVDGVITDNPDQMPKRQ